MKQNVDMTTIKQLPGFVVLNWHYNQKNEAVRTEKEVMKRHIFHGALLMFSDIHDLYINDVIDTLVNHNESGRV